MVSRGAVAAIVGIGAVAAIGIGVYLASRPSGGGGGGGGGGGCQSGYFECLGGACCPDGDTCANSNGTCPASTSPDPNNKGCCINACPPSCAQDSDCANCGPGFVCEGAECTKQIPAQIRVSSLTAVVPQAMVYEETCCNYVFYSTCKKCHGSWSGGTVGINLQVIDAYGRGVPGIALDIVPNGDGFSVSVNGGIAVTNSDGNVGLTITATAAVADLGNTDNSNYPCNACGSSTPDTGQLTGSYGWVYVSAPGFASLGTAAVAVEGQLDYSATSTYGGGCGCV